MLPGTPLQLRLNPGHSFTVSTRALEVVGGCLQPIVRTGRACPHLLHSVALVSPHLDEPDQRYAKCLGSLLALPGRHVIRDPFRKCSPLVTASGLVEGLIPRKDDGMPAPRKYQPELRERSIRLVRER